MVVAQRYTVSVESAMGFWVRTCFLWVLAVWRKCTNSSRKKLLLGTTGTAILCIIAVDFHGRGLGVHTLTLGLSGLFFRPHRKMLIYVCMEGQGCAGWGDRQKSMVGMFLLALVTDRQFGILLQTPCDVRNFYMPNEYDWTVNEKDLEGRSQRLIYPADNLSSIDFNQKYPEDVLFGRVNSECFWKITSNARFKPLLPSWAQKRYSSYFHFGWNILMKPTPKVQRRLDRFLESVNYYNTTKPLVGVHMRVGKNPSNPLERRSFYNVSNLGPLWRRVEQYVRNGSQLFVASDSEEVRHISRRRFGSAHHDTSGVIMHMGKQRHDVGACQGFEDAILDQLILSYCEVMFMSRGGFAAKASLMGRRVKKNYVFQHGKVSP